ncbi:pseudouridine synthase [Pseudogemmobacter sonorensis]|uniref:pseudouridine synthase n=1 Tax=Pseudogemmobacter sonorensis TaxID=2989681 RepID=UPI0036D0EEAE
MADKSTPAGPTPAKTAPAGERIAKVLSRRGVASRREAERLIEAGEVTVNGRVIDSPALNVTGADRITVSGKALPDEAPARLWLYYKPEGLVTSASDEKGRDTVFDHLPEDMPRVMSVGRLDLNSEGLLLLTNDGALKRRLELPSTGWLRKYRVRVNGAPDDVKLQPLRDGITVEGEHFQPMQVTLDRQQGANAWLTVGLREGRNREIRRAMNAVGLYVNRLIRVSYGPFRLGELQPGQVEEVRPRVLRDQLGEDPREAAPTTETARRPGRAPVGRGAKPGAKPTAKPGSGSDRRQPSQVQPGGSKPDGGKARAGGPGKAAAATGKATATRTPALPRPLKPGEGLRSLSAAWKTAVTPRLSPQDGPEPAARPGKAKPAAKTGTRPAAKPAGSRVAGTTRKGAASPKAEPKTAAARKEAPDRTGDRTGGKPAAAAPRTGKPVGERSGPGAKPVSGARSGTVERSGTGGKAPASATTPRKAGVAPKGRGPATTRPGPGPKPGPKPGGGRPRG